MNLGDKVFLRTDITFPKHVFVKFYEDRIYRSNYYVVVDYRTDNAGRVQVRFDGCQHHYPVEYFSVRRIDSNIQNRTALLFSRNYSFIRRGDYVIPRSSRHPLFTPSASFSLTPAEYRVESVVYPTENFEGYIVLEGYNTRFSMLEFIQSRRTFSRGDRVVPITGMNNILYRGERPSASHIERIGLPYTVETIEDTADGQLLGLRTISGTRCNYLFSAKWLELESLCIHSPSEGVKYKHKEVPGRIKVTLHSPVSKAVCRDDRRVKLTKGKEYKVLQQSFFGRSKMLKVTNDIGKDIFYNSRIFKCR